MRMKTIYITLLTLGICSHPLKAQLADEVVYDHDYSLERIVVKSNWLSSANPAGLMTNYISKSYVQTSYESLWGTYRNVTDGSNLNRFDLKTESYKRFDRFSVYGKLEYFNDRANDRAWYGTMHPEKTVMVMGDSIPGKTREEYYLLQGGIAFELGNGFSVGAAIQYEAGTLAKRKDARNLNEYMDLQIRPGVTYSSKWVNAGVNVYFDRFTQKVNYSVFGTNSRIPASFLFDGMWFYNALLVSTGSSYPDPRHKGMTYGGAGQIEINITPDFKFFNQLSMNYGVIGRYSRRNMEMLGSEERLEYNYSGIVSLSSGCVEHQLKLNFDYQDVMKYNNIQRLEPVPGTFNTDLWVQYGKMLKLSGNTKTFGANYSLYLQRNDYHSSWTVQAGIELFQKSMEYRILPVLYTQQIKFTHINLGVAKNIITGRKSFLDINLYAHLFRGGEGYPFQENAPQDLVMNQVNVFLDLVQQEYNYLTANRYQVGGNVRFTHKLPTRLLMSIYAQIGAHTTSVSSAMPDTYRNGLMGTVGLNF